MKIKNTPSLYQILFHASPCGFMRPIWYETAKHLYRLFSDAEYRRYYWLVAQYGNVPRFHQREIRFHGWDLIVPDVASFLSACREIFVEHIYAFPSESKKPVILDCGANIGLSVLYFKILFPGSTVIAYEADPALFAVLQNNIRENGITNVELHNKAVWSSETIVEFNVDGADGGRINIGSDKNLIPVPTVSLASLIQDQRFDFIKIDIEGAEIEALKGCEDLNRLHYVFVEFHSFLDKKQELGTLIDCFERNGFRVHVHAPFTTKKPFMHHIEEDYGMDMRLNLFFINERLES